MAGKKSKKKQVHLKTRFSAPKHPSSPPLSCDPEVASSSFASEEPADALPKQCRHLERGVSLDKLAVQLSKPKFSLHQCQYCLKETKLGSSKKGKGRSTRKKTTAAIEQCSDHHEEKWVCLACGHVACGSLSGNPNRKQGDKEQAGNEKDMNRSGHAERVLTGHASNHSFYAKHPLALKTADKLTCWCFMCNMAVEYAPQAASSCDNDGDVELASSNSPLQVAVKLLHEKLMKVAGFQTNTGKRSFTLEPVRSAVDDVPHLNSVDVFRPSPTMMTMHRGEAQRMRIVKGLMNLGNTCFFNSVMQNLLALDILRDYFSQGFQDFEGPLTSSLRKLYIETNPDSSDKLSTPLSEASGFESGLRRGAKGRAMSESSGSVCNPRSLFGVICAKAPRFKGFQQQDSHELLRYLLDGLVSEDRTARAKSIRNGQITRGANAAVVNSELMENGEGKKLEPSEERSTCQNSDNLSSSSPPATTTFVESVFGGQLCSTVRCCECGHSSVVYETILDLSLQIPKPLKKGNKSENLLKSPSYARAPQTAVTRRDGKDEKASPKSGLQEGGVKKEDAPLNVSPSGLAEMTDGLPAVGATSPKLAATDASALDDFGWLDFVGGGIQSAESSIQGSCDAWNSLEVSESMLVLGEDCTSGNPLQTVIQSHVVNDSNIGKNRERQERVEETVAAASMGFRKPCSEILDGSFKMPQSAEGGDSHPHSDGEDGPLPLASGVLLLPYEPLDGPVHTRGGESSGVSESKANFGWEGAASPLSEEEAGDFDGFFQLFEEDDSFYASCENKVPSTAKQEDQQVTEESLLDDSGWGDAETTDSGLGRSQSAAGFQRSVNYEDVIVPMSLEACLADFTEPELLSGENAWECESCSWRLKAKALSWVGDGLVGNADHFVSMESIPNSGGLGKAHQAGKEVACSMMSCIRNGSTSYTDSQSEDCDGLSGGSTESTQVTSLSVSHHLNGLAESPRSSATSSSRSQVGPVAHKPMLDAEDITHTVERLHLGRQSALNSLNQDVKEDCNGISLGLPTESTEKLGASSNKMMKTRRRMEKLVKRDATKKLSISKAPHILTIHLKRFAQDMRGRLSKLGGHVAFPETLDLWPFLEPRYCDLDSCFYKLVGVVEHGGTMRAGHYIAYARGPCMEETTEQGRKHLWYYISDSSVRPASLAAVLNSEAYLLFYEKVQSP